MHLSQWDKLIEDILKQSKNMRIVEWEMED
jgi:hypothetical protein